jgi:hypothetical protein
MYREAPKLAVWAATNHPAAFGETTVTKPGRLDIKVLKELPASERPKPEAWTKEHARAQRDEIDDLKRTAKQERAKRAADANRRAVRDSIELVARQAETAICHDPAEAKSSAERLRALGKELDTMTPDAAPTRRTEQPERNDDFSDATRRSHDKAARYKDPENRLRQQDRTPPKLRDLSRDRDR